ncbi:MAG: hypothetical protein H0V80_03795, partial [Acidobacteria bacterium]|nr:hypothetical protein [Acidobacteriota bacterium]
MHTRVHAITTMAAVVVLSSLMAAPVSAQGDMAPRVPVRGIYGGVPQEVLDSGRSLREFGVDAVW